ncbi:MAG: aminotransferase class V-fold PLP-dependent enzyme [Rhodothermales bacterium]
MNDSKNQAGDTNLDLETIRALERAARRLDPGPENRHSDADQVVAHAVRFLDDARTAPAYRRSEDVARGLLDTPLSEDGIGLDRALGLLHDFVDTEGLSTTSGRFGGYIPGGGLFHAALGDFLAAITNKYAGVFFASPGAVRMENLLVRWMADLVGFPAEAAGYLAAGGSGANLTAVVTARDAMRIEGRAVPRVVLYATEHTHHCVDKALHIAGLNRVTVRRVAVDDGHRMRPEALQAAIRSDSDQGLVPWMVIASAGTTNTGSIDPLHAIGDIAGAESLWFHVDAAYGGFFLLTEYGQERLRGIEMADSVVMDPHKTLFLPYGIGALLVRDGRKLHASHAAGADYMQDTRTGENPDAFDLDPFGTASPAELSPELTKHFRGLRMWLPLQVLGVAPFRAALEEKLLLARYFRKALLERGVFEVGPEPDLSVVTFRLPGSDDRNRRLVADLHADGRIFLSSTVLDGRFTLRMAAVCHRTHQADINTMVDVLHECAARLD